ncbi:hypothetical protein F5Y14DRAFT_400668, partial [Nemania sp. NC0429]
MFSSVCLFSFGYLQELFARDHLDCYVKHYFPYSEEDQNCISRYLFISNDTVVKGAQANQSNQLVSHQVCDED